MTPEPVIIQQGNRKAIIRGNSLQLFHVKVRPKKKPVDEPVWPAVDKGSEATAWHDALLWLKKSYIETGEGSRH